MKMLTLDLSTTCTGWALFDIQTKKLEKYGFVKPSKKGMAKLTYPEKQLRIMQDIASQLISIIYREDGFSIDPPRKDLIKKIVIEEVNLHKSRLTGKTLDGMHWILLSALAGDNDVLYIRRVKYRDSDGPVGWRTKLQLTLSEMDKKQNKLHKAINKKKKKGTPDMTIITKKHLAARYVNSKLGTSFDVEQNATDNDVVDAIGMGLAEFLTEG